MAGRVADRLSALPDELLHHILSFNIDTKESIRMSILSTRWRNIWLSVPSISLTCRQPPWATKAFTRFVEFVIYFRMNCGKNLNIRSFSLSDAKYDQCPVSYWVSRALDLGAQDLYLKSVDLISPPVLSQVKTLSLSYVALYSDSPDRELFLSLENVENLTMKGCLINDIKKISICAPLLKCMVLRDDYRHESWSCDFALQGPNVTSIDLDGSMFKDYNLGVLSSLTTAHINIMLRDMKRTSYDMSLRKILVAICKVRSLTLSANAFQIYAGLPKRLPTELKSSGNTFHNLKFLKLINWQDHGRIEALGRLLTHFHSLQTIVLERAKESFGPKVKSDDWGAKLSFRCSLTNLKTIEVINIDGSDNELKFLDFLLHNSLDLEKLILQKSFWMEVNKEHKLMQYCAKLPSHLKVFCSRIRN